MRVKLLKSAVSSALMFVVAGSVAAQTLCHGQVTFAGSWSGGAVAVDTDFSPHHFTLCQLNDKDEGKAKACEKWFDIVVKSKETGMPVRFFATDSVACDQLDPNVTDFIQVGFY